MGVSTDAPELLASFPQNVANAQFGSGAGFDPNKLYVAGAPGSVYRRLLTAWSAEVGVDICGQASSASEAQG